MKNLTFKLLSLISLLMLCGCPVKDGEYARKNGYFYVVENSSIVELNNYKLVIPSEGGYVEKIVLSVNDYVDCLKRGKNPESFQAYLSEIEGHSVSYNINGKSIKAYKRTLTVVAGPNNAQEKEVWLDFANILNIGGRMIVIQPAAGK